MELRDTLLFFGVDYGDDPSFGMVQSRNGIFLGQTQVARICVHMSHKTDVISAKDYSDSVLLQGDALLGYLGPALGVIYYRSLLTVLKVILYSNHVSRTWFQFAALFSETHP